MTLEEIIQKLEQDPRNRMYTERGVPPVFQIHPEARVLIIGQAPGRKVEESRIPFHDKSGEKLMSWMGVSPEQFYSEKVAIMPMDFYYPGKGKTGDLPPRGFIAEEYHRELLDLMQEIRLTMLIGKYSMEYYLRDFRQPPKRNLTETVQSYAQYLPEYFPLVHPSPLNFRWQKKNPWFEEEVVPYLRERVKSALED